MAIAVYNPTNYSNPFLDTLISGYSFTGTISYYLDGAGWNGDNAESAFKGAIDAWAAVANIEFDEVGSAGRRRYMDGDTL